MRKIQREEGFDGYVFKIQITYIDKLYIDIYIDELIVRQIDFLIDGRMTKKDIWKQKQINK